MDETASAVAETTLAGQAGAMSQPGTRPGRINLNGTTAKKRKKRKPRKLSRLRLLRFFAAIFFLYHSHFVKLHIFQTFVK
jgi:hypothetical protein